MSESLPGPLPAEREAGFILLPVCFLLPGPLLAVLYPGLSSAYRSVLSSAAVLLCALFVFRKSLRLRLKSDKPAFRHLLLPFLKSIGIYLLSLAAVSLITRLCGAEQNPNDMHIRSMLAEAGPLFAISLLITGPVSEELFFRFFIFSSLRKYGFVVSVVVTYIVFALLHLLPFMFSVPFSSLLPFFLQYLPVTLAICWLYEKTGSLWCSICAHALNNMLALAYYYAL